MIFLNIWIYLIFFAINAKIIFSDTKYNIIPNRCLIYLLLFLPIWRMSIIGDFSIVPIEQVGYFLLSACINIIVVFWLYHFKLWWAWDSKYIYILSLYLPSYELLLLFWNTALITLWILIWYFVYFYTIKLIFYKNFRQSILSIIHEKYSDTVVSFFDTSKSFTTKLNLMIWFLLLYVSIRFLRGFFIEYMYLPEIKKYWEVYTQDIFYVAIIMFIASIYLILIWTRIFFKKIESKWYSSLIIKNICLYVSSFALITFILSQYLAHPKETKEILVLIFTIYLFIFITVVIWKYLINISFYLNERYAVSLDNLRVGMIIDRDFISHLLKGREDLAEDMEYNPKSKALSSDDIKWLKKTIKYINLNIKKNKKNESLIDTILVIKTFPYSIYIYSGFLLSFIVGNQIISLLVASFKSLLMK